MPFSHFADRLIDAVKQKQTPLVVGIDPRANQLPTELIEDNSAIAERFAKFGMAVVDAVADLVPAVKPQAAFFEQLGPAGLRRVGECGRLRSFQRFNCGDGCEARRYRVNCRSLRCCLPRSKTRVCLGL